LCKDGNLPLCWSTYSTEWKLEIINQTNFSEAKSRETVPLSEEHIKVFYRTVLSIQCGWGEEGEMLYLEGRKGKIYGIKKVMHEKLIFPAYSSKLIFRKVKST
jgi:hypothetical protein